MSTYFLLDPFEFPYYFYRIRGELIYVLSIYVLSNQFPRPEYDKSNNGNSNGSRRKYVDIKCLLCLMKFALTKKCCLNIYIYIYSCICGHVLGCAHEHVCVFFIFWCKR